MQGNLAEKHHSMVLNMLPQIKIMFLPWPGRQTDKTRKMYQFPEGIMDPFISTAWHSTYYRSHCEGEDVQCCTSIPLTLQGPHLHKGIHNSPSHSLPFDSEHHQPPNKTVNHPSNSPDTWSTTIKPLSWQRCLRVSLSSKCCASATAWFLSSWFVTAVFSPSHHKAKLNIEVQTLHVGLFCQIIEMNISRTPCWQGLTTSSCLNNTGSGDIAWCN